MGCAAWFGVASPAHAAERVAVADGYITAGPFIAGERTAWEEQDCESADGVRCPALEDDSEAAAGFVRLRIGAPGRPPRTLRRTEVGLGSSQYDPPDLVRRDLFSTKWRVESVDQEADAGQGPLYFRRRLRLASTTGTLRRFSQCLRDAEVKLPSGAVALSGDHLAFQTDSCRVPQMPLAVRNLENGSETLVPSQPGVDLTILHLAGRFLLLSRQTPETAADTPSISVVLVNWATGATVSSVRVPPGLTLGPTALSLGGLYAASWHSPSTNDFPCRGSGVLIDPRSGRQRVLPSPVCPALAFARERLVVGDRVRTVGRGVDDLQIPTRLSSLVVSGPRRIVAKFGVVGTADHVDADRRGRVLFGVIRCDRRRDILRLEPGERRFDAGSSTCTAIPEPRAVLRGSRLRVSVRCPRGCKGLVSLYYRGRRLATSRIRSSRGAPATLRLHGPARRLSRMQLVAHGRLRTRVATRGDIDGDASVVTRALRVVR